MRNRLTYLISFVLVSGLVTSLAEGADPNLIGWWRFDEGSGTTAYDTSGKGNDGTLVGGAAWATGRFGGGIKLDGTSGYVSIPNFEMTTDTITFAIWLNGWKGANWAPLISSREFTACEMNFGTNDTLHYTWNNDSLTTYNWTGGPVIPQDTWTMLAVTIDPSGATAYVYTDADGLKQATNAITHIEQTVGALQIGYSYGSRYVRGIVDEAAIFSRALTKEEILGLASGIGGGYPYVLNPSPAEGQMITETWVELTWQPGDFAVSHDVYLSDNFDDVNAGAAGAFLGNLPDASYIAGLPGLAYPDGLVPGTTYYWRIDEVNQADPNSPWKGPVWSFWIPPKQAYDPSPPDGAKYLPQGLTLSWTGGLNAKLHTIYFGDNLDTVTNAVGRPRQSAATYTPAGPLQMGKTYYWRVDEYEPPSTHKGKVWSFTTIPDIAVTDPNLVGWWTFDEGQGTTAVDWSGHKNYGELRGDLEWVAGQDGDALNFDGTSDFVFTGKSASALGVEAGKPKTVTAWVYTRAFNNGAVFDLGARTNGQEFCLRTLATSDQWRAQHWGTAFNHDFSYPSQDVWVHFALVYTGTQSTVYANGMPVSSEARTLDTSSANPFQIGCYGWQVSYFDGLIDDVRLYNKALSPEELQVVMRGVPTRAGNPSPANGAISDVARAATLSWSPGEAAAQHAVYFGTDRDAVAKADASDATGIYRGLQSAASYTLPQALEWAGGPYYWRVDEHNNDGTITTGTLWSFSVTDYVLVDNFESYNDMHFEEPGSNLVYLAWKDGFENPSANGATTGYLTGASLETTTVHSGRQSVPLIYDNSTAALSEVERTFAAQNWTDHGVLTLSLWFFGDGNNVPGQLYIKLNGVKVAYDGEPANLMQTTWHPWTIELASVGADLQSVTTLGVGIEGEGAKGTLLLDDIRLYPRARELITPVEPNAAGLVAYYRLDQDANDSSGSNNHGTLAGNPQWVGGKMDGALQFDGTDDYVDCGGGPSLDITGKITIAAWIYPTGSGSSDFPRIVDKSSGTGLADPGYKIYLRAPQNYVVSLSAGGDSRNSSLPVVLNTWNYVVFSVTGTQWRFFLNGTWQQWIETAKSSSADKSLFIGNSPTAKRHFEGLIDDVRIYNRELTLGEIAWLAGRTAPFEEPF